MLGVLLAEQLQHDDVAGADNIVRRNGNVRGGGEGPLGGGEQVVSERLERLLDRQQLDADAQPLEGWLGFDALGGFGLVQALEHDAAGFLQGDGGELIENDELLVRDKCVCAARLRAELRPVSRVLGVFAPESNEYGIGGLEARGLWCAGFGSAVGRGLRFLQTGAFGLTGRGFGSARAALQGAQQLFALRWRQLLQQLLLLLGQRRGRGVRWHRKKKHTGDENPTPKPPPNLHAILIEFMETLIKSVIRHAGERRHLAVVLHHFRHMA